MLAKLARIGVAPGQPPDWGPLERMAVRLGRWIADRTVRARAGAAARSGQRLVHAAVAAGRLRHATTTSAPWWRWSAWAPTCRPTRSTPTRASTPTGQPLNGSHRYRLHFAAGQLPPVHAFWSLTAYGADDFLIANPLHRHALGDRDPLVFNADGSLDLWVQAEPPPADSRPTGCR